MVTCDGPWEQGGMGRVEPAVSCIGDGRIGMSGAEPEAGLGFPRVIEALSGNELVVRKGGAPVREHTASVDCRELGRVADQHEAPSVFLGQGDERGQVSGGRHAGLVEHDGRAGRFQRVRRSAVVANR